MRKWKNEPGEFSIDIPMTIHFLSSGYYDPGVRTLRNGDPGYPPEGDDERVLDYVEIDDVCIRLPQEIAQKLFDLCLEQIDAVEMEYSEPDYEED